MDQTARPDSPDPKIISLASAVRMARVEGVERSQVVAELRGAEMARLEMLRDGLAPVLAQVPQGIDLFDAGLMPGEHPRLFIDMIGFVEMARDRRTYRLVQDTRHGRVVMAESDRIDVMEQAVTQYIARRMVERERALASDGTLQSALRSFAAPERAPAPPASRRPPPAGTGAPGRKRRRFYAVMRFLIEFLGIFTLGMLLISGILAAFYFGYPTARMWLLAHFGWPAG